MHIFYRGKESRRQTTIVSNSLLNFTLFIYLFIYIYVLSERESKGEGKGRERERERERESKQAPCSAQSPMWGLIPRPWDYDLSRNQELDTQQTEPPKHPCGREFLHFKKAVIFALHLNYIFICQVIEV